MKLRAAVLNVSILLIALLFGITFLSGMRGVPLFHPDYAKRPVVAVVNDAFIVNVYFTTKMNGNSIACFYANDVTGTTTKFQAITKLHSHLVSKGKPDYTLEIYDKSVPLSISYHYLYYPDTGELGEKNNWGYVSPQFKAWMKKLPTVWPPL